MPEPDANSGLGVFVMMKLAAYVVLGSLAFTPAAFGDAPDAVSYQGVLTVNGIVVEDGLYELKLGIFGNPSGGTSIFEQTLSIQVMDGLYNVILSGATLTSALKSGTNRFMQVTIQAGPGITSAIPLSPRQQITSAPYALVAKEAATIASGAWQTAGLSNGWADYNQGWPPASYFKDGTGIVHLRGFIKNAAATNAWTAIFTMPSGYRPAYVSKFDVRACCLPGTNTEFSASVHVAGGGAVSHGELLATGYTTYLSLDGISFRAEP